MINNPIARQTEHAERLTLYYLPPLLCMGLIFYLSSRSWVPIPLPVWMIVRDKVAHGIMYGFLCYLWIRAFRAGEARSLTPSLLVVAVCISALYGATDEYHQSFVPGRTATFGDFAADALGAAVLAGITFFRQRTLLFRQRD
ncbi:MAG TPA: VanZ family protein [bacterium]|nr:VanZ family protein [bacterium]